MQRVVIMTVHIHIHSRDATFDPTKKRNLNTESPRETAARVAYARSKPESQKLDIFLKMRETGKEYKETLKLGPRDLPEQVASSFFQRMQTMHPDKFVSMRFVAK